VQDEYRELLAGIDDRLVLLKHKTPPTTLVI
jgi:hypothetical protein